MDISYFDDHVAWKQGQAILSEKWKVDRGTGQLFGVGIQDHTSFNRDTDAKKRLSWFIGADLDDAMGLTKKL